MNNILTTKNFIGGDFLSSDKTLIVLNKYTQNPIAEVYSASAKQVEEAITTSISAFKIMRKTSAEQRANYLNEIAIKLDENKEAFAKLISQEAGKPISLAQIEVNRAVDLFRTAQRETYSFCGEMVPIDFHNGVGKTAFLKKEPLGVIFGIAPFNFPLNLAIHKIAPAIATGNSIILKPSPFTPLCTLSLAKLINETSLPKGAVNIIFTEDTLAERIVTDERIKMFSFTGSPKIGWMLKNKVGNKKITLELGGNAPVIIDENITNIESIAKAIVNSAFFYSGQVCISTQRALIHKNIYSQFVNLLIEATKNIKSGDISNPKVINGPIISKEHLHRIDKTVKEAVKKGAKILIGGEILDNEHNVYAPTIISQTTKEMEIYCEEIFAPVMIVKEIASFNEGIIEANDTQYGLQAGVFTNNFENIKFAMEELEYGGVMINNTPTFRVDSMPYGGIKKSGIGKEGIKTAMEEFTEKKIIIF